jgi:hypothetical protein
MPDVLAPHVSNPRVEAAIRARDLPFIRRHWPQITPSLRQRARVWGLIAEQDPAGVEAFAADFIAHWATEAPKPQTEDYRLILKACDEIPAAPDRVADELVALCAHRGVD